MEDIFGQFKKVLLFGINNGRIEDINIYGSMDASGNNRGGLCYFNNGTIFKCTNYATIRSKECFGVIAYSNKETGIIEKCFNNATTSLNCYLAAGGIAFENFGIISKCINNSDLREDTNSGYIAGIVLDNKGGRIENCINTGDIDSHQECAGICYTNNAEIKNCYNVGNMIVTWYSAAICRNNNGKISNCYNTGTLGTAGGPLVLANKNIENSYSLNVAGNLPTSNYINCSKRTEEQLKSDEQITLLNEGNATEVWVKDTGNINNGYPILKWQLETN